MQCPPQHKSPEQDKGPQGAPGQPARGGLGQEHWLLRRRQFELARQHVCILHERNGPRFKSFHRFEALLRTRGPQASHSRRRWRRSRPAARRACRRRCSRQRRRRRRQRRGRAASARRHRQAARPSAPAAPSSSRRSDAPAQVFPFWGERASPRLRALGLFAAVSVGFRCVGGACAERMELHCVRDRGKRERRDCRPASGVSGVQGKNGAAAAAAGSHVMSCHVAELAPPPSADAAQKRSDHSHSCLASFSSRAAACAPSRAQHAQHTHAAPIRQAAGMLSQRRARRGVCSVPRSWRTSTCASPHRGLLRHARVQKELLRRARDVRAEAGVEGGARALRRRLRQQREDGVAELVQGPGEAVEDVGVHQPWTHCAQRNGTRGVGRRW